MSIGLNQPNAAIDSAVFDRLPNHSGLVWVLMLEYLSIMLLALLALWQEAGLQWRINHNQYEQIRLTQAAEFGLRMANQRLLAEDSICQRPFQTQAIMLERSEHWWQSTGICHDGFNGIRIDYYFAFLQQEKLPIGLSESPVEYWQLIAHAVKGHQIRLLQATVIGPSRSPGHCGASASEEANGRCNSLVFVRHHWQSWSQLA